MCHDTDGPSRILKGMANGDTQSEYTMAFIGRVKEARDDTDYTQEEIAGLLDIKQGKYKQYETRDFMPHQYIMLFCALTGVTIEWLFGTKGAAKAKKKKSGARRDRGQINPTRQCPTVYPSRQRG